MALPVTMAALSADDLWLHGLPQLPSVLQCLSHVIWKNGSMETCIQLVAFLHSLTLLLSHPKTKAGNTQTLRVLVKESRNDQAAVTRLVVGGDVTVLLRPSSAGMTVAGPP